MKEKKLYICSLLINAGATHEPKQTINTRRSTSILFPNYLFLLTTSSPLDAISTLHEAPSCIFFFFISQNNEFFAHRTPINRYALQKKKLQAFCSL